MMSERAIRRWESARARGLWHFVLTVGIFRFGVGLLIIAIIGWELELWRIRRLLGQAGAGTVALGDDLLSFIPELLPIALALGVSWGVVMWFWAERSYRIAVEKRAHADQGATAYPAAAADAVGCAAVAAEPPTVRGLKSLTVMKRPRAGLVGFLVAGSLFAAWTVLEPHIERSRERRVAELGAKMFAPHQAFYDLTREVQVAARCQDAGIIRSLVPKASTLQRNAENFKTDWNYGNAIHYSNLALGRAALVDGDSTLAAKYLLQAGKTPGSPQLGDYGPDMTLAAELLQCGQRQAVLEYLESCEKFWFNRGKAPPLREWANVVRGGGTPDFGSRAGKPLKNLP
jgi:hypothetical protein